AGKEIVHRFVKLDPEGGELMVKQEEDAFVLFLAESDLDGIRNLEQGMEITKLAQPGDQVAVEMLMALSADIDGFAKAEGVHGHGWPAGVEVFGEGGEDLAFLRFDDIAPQPGGMQVAGGES